MNLNAGATYDNSQRSQQRAAPGAPDPASSVRQALSGGKAVAAGQREDGDTGGRPAATDKTARKPWFPPRAIGQQALRPGQPALNINITKPVLADRQNREGPTNGVAQKSMAAKGILREDGRRPIGSTTGGQNQAAAARPASSADILAAQNARHNASHAVNAAALPPFNGSASMGARQAVVPAPIRTGQRSVSTGYKDDCLSQQKITVNGVLQPIKPFHRTMDHLKAGKFDEAFANIKAAGHTTDTAKTRTHLEIYFPWRFSKPDQHEPRDCLYLCDGSPHPVKQIVCRFCKKNLPPNYNEHERFNCQLAVKHLDAHGTCALSPDDRRFLLDGFFQVDKWTLQALDVRRELPRFNRLGEPARSEHWDAGAAARAPHQSQRTRPTLPKAHLQPRPVALRQQPGHQHETQQQQQQPHRPMVKRSQIISRDSRDKGKQRQGKSGSSSAYEHGGEREANILDEQFFAERNREEFEREREGAEIERQLVGIEEVPEEGELEPGQWGVAGNSIENSRESDEEEVDELAEEEAFPYEKLPERGIGAPPNQQHGLHEAHRSWPTATQPGPASATAVPDSAAGHATGAPDFVAPESRPAIHMPQRQNAVVQADHSVEHSQQLAPHLEQFKREQGQDSEETPDLFARQTVLGASRAIKPYRETMAMIRGGSEANPFENPFATDYTDPNSIERRKDQRSHIEVYFPWYPAIAEPHNPNRCGFVCGGVPHPFAGPICRFCRTKIGFKTDTAKLSILTALSHLQHPEKCGLPEDERKLLVAAFEKWDRDLLKDLREKRQMHNQNQQQRYQREREAQVAQQQRPDTREVVGKDAGLPVSTSQNPALAPRAEVISPGNRRRSTLPTPEPSDHSVHSPPLRSTRPPLCPPQPRRPSPTLTEAASQAPTRRESTAWQPDSLGLLNAVRSAGSTNSRTNTPVALPASSSAHTATQTQQREPEENSRRQAEVHGQSHTIKAAAMHEPAQSSMSHGQKLVRPTSLLSTMVSQLRPAPQQQQQQERPAHPKSTARPAAQREKEMEVASDGSTQTQTENRPAVSTRRSDSLFLPPSPPSVHAVPSVKVEEGAEADIVRPSSLQVSEPRGRPEHQTRAAPASPSPVRPTPAPAEEDAGKQRKREDMVAMPILDENSSMSSSEDELFAAAGVEQYLTQRSASRASNASALSAAPAPPIRTVQKPQHQERTGPPLEALFDDNPHHRDPSPSSSAAPKPPTVTITKTAAKPLVSQAISGQSKTNQPGLASTSALPSKPKPKRRMVPEVEIRRAVIIEESSSSEEESDGNNNSIARFKATLEGRQKKRKGKDRATQNSTSKAKKREDDKPGRKPIKSTATGKAGPNKGQVRAGDASSSGSGSDSDSEQEEDSDARYGTQSDGSDSDSQYVTATQAVPPPSSSSKRTKKKESRLSGPSKPPASCAVHKVRASSSASASQSQKNARLAGSTKPTAPFSRSVRSSLSQEIGEGRRETGRKFVRDPYPASRKRKRSPARRKSVIETMRESRRGSRKGHTDKDKEQLEGFIVDDDEIVYETPDGGSVKAKDSDDDSSSSSSSSSDDNGGIIEQVRPVKAESTRKRKALPPSSSESSSDEGVRKAQPSKKRRLSSAPKRASAPAKPSPAFTRGVINSALPASSSSSSSESETDAPPPAASSQKAVLGGSGRKKRVAVTSSSEDELEDQEELIIRSRGPVSSTTETKKLKKPPSERRRVLLNRYTDQWSGRAAASDGESEDEQMSAEVSQKPAGGPQKIRPKARPSAAVRADDSSRSKAKDQHRAKEKGKEKAHRVISDSEDDLGELPEISFNKSKAHGPLSKSHSFTSFANTKASNPSKSGKGKPAERITDANMGTSPIAPSTSEKKKTKPDKPKSKTKADASRDVKPVIEIDIDDSSSPARQQPVPAAHSHSHSRSTSTSTSISTGGLPTQLDPWRHVLTKSRVSSMGDIRRKIRNKESVDQFISWIAKSLKEDKDVELREFGCDLGEQFALGQALRGVL